MKKLLATLLCGMMLFSMASCNTRDQISKETTQPSPEATLSVQDLSVETPYQPVSSYQKYFVVRNKSNSMYGLIDKKGSVVLPCEFGEVSFAEAKSQTVLKVMNKGSYGVYDLQGQELIPCEYTEITLTPYADLCMVETFTGENDVLDFNGESILPTAYDIVKFAYGKVVVGNSATEKQEGCIEVYQPNGTLIKSFSIGQTSIFDLLIGNGGNTITIISIEDGKGAADYQNCLVVEGDDILWSNTLVVDEKLVYFNGNSLEVMNSKTDERTSVWNFKEEGNWEMFSIQKVSEGTDPVTGVKYADISIDAIGGEKTGNVRCYLRIIFDQTYSAIDYTEAGINRWITGGDELSDFYNGVAMVLPDKGYLYTIDINGDKKVELSNPYTDRDKSFLIGNAAVLNNNGYYSIVNTQGEILLSEDGYSSVGTLNVNGLYVITDQNGKIGLIDRYAEELVPCGGIDSVETGVERASSESWELESSKVAEDELYILYNGDMWAVYSALETKLITEFQEMDGEAETQYNCFLGNGGYPLIDEDGKSVYLISYNNENYKIIPVK